MLNLNLPFFGKRGTIHTIIETENNYQVKRHGIKEEQTVPKKHKNLIGLYQNYYQDISGYLEYHQEQYQIDKIFLEKKKSAGKLKEKLDMKKIKIGVSLCLGSILVTSPLILSSIPFLAYTGIIVTSLSITCLYATANMFYHYKKDKKKITFINQYDNYKKELKTYQEHTTKTCIPTKYNGLSSEKTIGNNLQMKKVKTLKENSHKNVA